MYIFATFLKVSVPRSQDCTHEYAEFQEAKPPTTAKRVLSVIGEIKRSRRLSFNPNRRSLANFPPPSSVSLSLSLKRFLSSAAHVSLAVDTLHPVTARTSRAILISRRREATSVPARPAIYSVAQRKVNYVESPLTT